MNRATAHRRDPSGSSDLHQGQGSGIGDADVIHPIASGLRHAPPGRNAAIAIALHVRRYQACARLEARTNPETLHDLRIAVRRLRSLVRPFRTMPEVVTLNIASSPGENGA
ncbi:CHAD domain-containing protein [Pseudomonas corrugata]|uniref:CHAD domain-containing protein n=2 Tax=Pseudomonas corrugata TaxID=47879 RepID=A0A8B6UYR5_9PSED|nr:CHAD domain-containing protein [Pseudomonas corrugata]